MRYHLLSPLIAGVFLTTQGHADLNPFVSLSGGVGFQSFTPRTSSSDNFQWSGGEVGFAHENNLNGKAKVMGDFDLALGLQAWENYKFAIYGQGNWSNIKLRRSTRQINTVAATFLQTDILSIDTTGFAWGLGAQFGYEIDRFEAYVGLGVIWRKCDIDFRVRESSLNQSWIPIRKHTTFPGFRPALGITYKLAPQSSWSAGGEISGELYGSKSLYSEGVTGSGSLTSLYPETVKIQPRMLACKVFIRYTLQPSSKKVVNRSLNPRKKKL